MLLHVLFEHASGYALFAVKEVEEIGMLLPQVRAFRQSVCGLSLACWPHCGQRWPCVSLQVEESVLNIGKFNSMVSLAAFFPFKSAQAALENMNAISEGEWDGLFEVASFCFILILRCDDVFNNLSIHWMSVLTTSRYAWTSEDHCFKHKTWNL